MKLLTALIPLCLAVATLSTRAPVQPDKRQLAGLTSIVCLTGELGSVVEELLSSLNISITECSAGETCNPLPILESLPTIGSLVPIGLCANSTAAAA